ncbi:MAG: amidohydrolase [Clostridia bacterium]|nr:amidohydrolase [Clostridia bacterium]
MNKLLKQLEAEESDLIETRNYLHLHPELSGEEINTLALISQRLTDMDIPYTEIEKGGILAELTNGIGGKTVLLRADMDALPVQESSCNLVRAKKVVSKNGGVSHVCGHDAHTAMLLTAAKLLRARISELNGTVLLCFERAEEGGGPGHSFGVKQILRYMDRNNIRPDSCFALHVDPRLDTGKLSVERGGVMAGSFGFEISIKGTGGHGSRPDLANNPLDCFTAFYQSLAAIRLRKISPYGLLTFSIPLVRTGTLGNLIDSELYFEGTARSLDIKSLEIFRDSFLNQLEHFTAAFGCEYRTELIYLEAPLCNDAEVADNARGVVKEMFGDDHYQAIEPNLGSESFADYTYRFPGAMAFLGIRNEELGSGAGLHADNFDIDENALKYGAGVLAGYALNELTDKN